MSRVSLRTVVSLVVAAALIALCLPHASLVGASGPDARGSIAISAAQNAGCIPASYTGRLTTKEETISSCLVSGFVYRDFVLPVCESNCEAVRLRPFATVTFACSSSAPPAVTCS
jgi:hypothetical protein